MVKNGLFGKTKTDIHHLNNTHSSKLQFNLRFSDFFFYMFEFSYHFQMFIYIFLEVRREDFYVMLTHHIATAVLIFVSYIYGELRIGIVILYVHDVTDIFNSLVKMVNNLKFPKLTVVFFVTVLVQWYYFI
jgi:hypothetical protein